MFMLDKPLLLYQLLHQLGVKLIDCGRKAGNTRIGS
jgi:hypothetical protein